MGNARLRLACPMARPIPTANAAGMGDADLKSARPKAASRYPGANPGAGEHRGFISWNKAMELD